jgi:hypothetical protein
MIALRSLRLVVIAELLRCKMVQDMRHPCVGDPAQQGGFVSQL